MVDIAHDAPAVGAPAGPPPGHAPHVVPAVVPRTIVPVKGLWIAGIVLAALIVAIATNKLWALEFFHVAFGGAWTAIDLFLGLVLGPILGTMSIPARVELTKRLMPKVAIIMPTIVTCTLAAGWQLGRLMGTIDSSYFHHGWVVASYIVVGAMALIALGYRALSLSATAHGPVKAMILDLDAKKAEAMMTPLLDAPTGSVSIRQKLIEFAEAEKLAL